MVVDALRAETCHVFLPERLRWLLRAVMVVDALRAETCHALSPRTS